MATKKRALTPAQLVEANDDERRRWLDQAVASLTPEALLEIEDQAYAVIDRRYPDDPTSFFNWRHHQGQVHKNRLRALFDQAFDRLVFIKVDHVEKTRTMFLRHYRKALSNELYGERRTVSRQRRADYIHDLVESALAADRELLRQLVVNNQTHQLGMAERQLEHTLDQQRLQLVADLEAARRAREHPHELVMALYDLLKSLTEYRMSLEDRALRHPGLNDRLQMMAVGLTQVMTSVNGLIQQLNVLGGHPPTPEQLQQQSDELLGMAMEQLNQWQQDVRTEGAP